MNKCGTCTACCTLLPIEPIDKPVNTPCQYCAGGCSVYDSKPETCTEFACAYLQGENVPEELRPDKCGIIFIKRTDRIFSGALMPEIKTTDLAKGQIRSFNEQGYSVVLISLKEKHPHLMLGKGHKAWTVMAEYKEAISGDV